MSPRRPAAPGIAASLKAKDAEAATGAVAMAIPDPEGRNEIAPIRPEESGGRDVRPGISVAFDPDIAQSGCAGPCRIRRAQAAKAATGAVAMAIRDP